MVSTFPGTNDNCCGFGGDRRRGWNREMLQRLLSLLSGKSSSNMLLHTSESECMLDVLHVRRGKDNKG